MGVANPKKRGCRPYHKIITNSAFPQRYKLFGTKQNGQFRPLFIQLLLFDVYWSYQANNMIMTIMHKNLCYNIIIYKKLYKYPFFLFNERLVETSLGVKYSRKLILFSPQLAYFSYHFKASGEVNCLQLFKRMGTGRRRGSLSSKTAKWELLIRLHWVQPNIVIGSVTPRGAMGHKISPVFFILEAQTPLQKTELELRPPKKCQTSFWGLQHAPDRPLGSPKFWGLHIQLVGVMNPAPNFLSTLQDKMGRMVAWGISSMSSKIYPCLLLVSLMMCWFNVTSSIHICYEQLCRLSYRFSPFPHTAINLKQNPIMTYLFLPKTNHNNIQSQRMISTQQCLKALGMCSEAFSWVNFLFFFFF
ncbi:hypothetical protein VP01_1329g3 [Puccinia sorghi]|uniref:Uncharacterized protein n=1 Tax=Puccinia sorghi TaxID=27349 RepID=A0A0L6VMG4_9BASI|nr:hypothetical protein VP01_1329g3 [Puccinia sorghi]